MMFVLTAIAYGFGFTLGAAAAIGLLIMGLVAYENARMRSVHRS